MATPATAPSDPGGCCPTPCAPSRGINFDTSDRTLKPLRSQGAMPTPATGVKGGRTLAQRSAGPKPSHVRDI